MKDPRIPSSAYPDFPYRPARFFRHPILAAGIIMAAGTLPLRAEVWSDWEGLPGNVTSIADDREGGVWLRSHTSGTIWHYRNGSASSAKPTDTGGGSLFFYCVPIVVDGRSMLSHAWHKPLQSPLPHSYHRTYRWDGAGEAQAAALPGQPFHADEAGVWVFSGRHLKVWNDGVSRDVAANLPFTNEMTITDHPIAHIMKFIPGKDGAFRILVDVGGHVPIAPVLYRSDPGSSPGLVQENTGSYPRGCCADAIVNPAGGLLVASDSGVWTYDNGVMARFGNDVSRVSRLYRDKRGTLWAAFHSGISGGTGGAAGSVSLRIWKANAWTVMRTQASTSPITGIAEDTHGNIWFVGAPRTLIYNPDGVTGLSEPANRGPVLRASRQAGARRGRWSWKGGVYDAKGGSR